VIELRAGTVEEAKALVNTLTVTVSRAGRHIGNADAYAADAVEVTHLTGQIAALFNVPPEPEEGRQTEAVPVEVAIPATLTRRRTRP